MPHTRPATRRTRIIASALAGIALVFGVIASLYIAPSAASAAVSCDRVASPSGSDSNAGTAASPYQTIRKLLGSLSAGQTGCLRTGTYGGFSSQTTFSTPNVTVTTYPGDTPATIQGFTYVSSSASGDTLSYLNIDNSDVFGSWPALCQGAVSSGAVVTGGFTVDGNNVTVEHDNIYVDPSIPTTHRGMGMGVGFNNSTSGDIIRNNRIHDVGFCPVEEHGIYLNKTSGIQIYGNWIYNIPAGTGIQVWDGPTNSHIYNNVIDGASSCFDVGGNSPDTSGTVIEHNICSNMIGVQNPYKAYCVSPGPGCTGPDPGAPLFDWWETGAAGSGNTVQNNLFYCASSAHCTTSTSDTSGVTLSGNISANPQFADPNYQTSHDYRLASGSPAASWGLWNGDMTSSPPTQPAPQPVTTTPTQPTTTTTTTTPVPPTTTTTPTAAAPATPAGVKAAGANGQVTITWSSNSAPDGVTHYNVYRTDQTFTGAWATPTATTFTNTSNVVNGFTYCYQVSATNAAGESGKSADVCATPRPTIPSVPTGLKVTAKQAALALTWTSNPAADYVTHYNVYRTDQTFTMPWASPLGTTFTNTSGLVAGKQYCYQLSATNSVGASGKTAPVCAAVPALVKGHAAVVRKHTHRRARHVAHKRPKRSHSRRRHVAKKHH